MLSRSHPNLLPVAVALLTLALPRIAASGEAEDILDTTADFYSGTSSMRTVMEVRIEMPEGMPAMPEDKPQRYELTLSRPTSLSALPVGNLPEPRFVQNDEQQYADLPFLKRYTLTDAVPLNRLFGGPESGPLAIPGLDTFLGFGAGAIVPGSLRGWNQPEILQDEAVDEVDCRHLAADHEMSRHEIWIAKGDRPWVMRYRVHPPAPADEPREEAPEGMLVFQPGLDYRFGDWRTDIDRETSFRIPPHAGFDRVETLFPPQGEMGDLFGGSHDSIGNPAPAVRLKPLNGKPVKLRSLGGKVVVLDFWASWCVPCVIELPLVSKVTSELTGRGVVFYAVNRGETADTVRTFLEERDMDLPVVMDSGNEVSSAFGVQAMPHLVVIDRAGTIRHVHLGSGPGTEERLRAELEALLAD